MHRVIHFEISADEPDRAIEFYSTVFGWNITKKGDYYLIHTGPQHEKGINGGMKARKKKGGLHASIPTIGVPDAKEFAKMVKENGGKIIQETIALQNTGYIAYCEDTEGNQFAILQYDSDAK